MVAAQEYFPAPMAGETNWLTVLLVTGAQAAGVHLAWTVLAWCLYLKEQVVIYGPDTLFLGTLCIAVGKYRRSIYNQLTGLPFFQ